MVVLLDLFRLFVGVTVLAFASYTDWKWRRAPNALWIFVALAGLLALATEAALDPAGMASRWKNLVFIPAFAALIYALWYVGLLAGGADAKALMALGVLLPFPVVIAGGVPAMPNPVPSWPLAVSVLTNSLVFFLAIPLAFLLWNLAHGHARLPHAILGVKRNASKVRSGHLWPMEWANEEGKLTTRYFSSRASQAELDEQYDRLEKLGDAKVWVTPKIPFMIPLLLGYVAAFFLGDVMLAAMRILLPT